MVKNDIRPYEISLWTLQDSFITVLKPIGLSNRGQIETPKCRIKNDGTQELNFSIPMYYRKDGELIENPIWYNVINGSLIANLRKLKLIFNKGEKDNEEVLEFVINKVTETHTNGELKCEVLAEGLVFQELGKIGYKISLSSQDYLDEYNTWAEENLGKEEDERKECPINNINYWCDKIFTNSRWDYEIQMDWSSVDGTIEEDYLKKSKEEKKEFNDSREKKKLRRLDKIYEEEYTTAWQEESGKLVPASMENFKEKCRQVDLEKSNFYNLTQSLAEIFGVHCKYKYDYDENYHIIGRHCIFYNNFLSEQEGKIDIIYPYSTSKIEREIESSDVVTKLFVTPIEDGTSASGLVTIADVSANKSREDYILNFDYLYNIGTISQEQYDAIKDYERSMYLKNTELEPLSSQIAKIQSDLVIYEAQLTLAQEGQILAKEQMEQSAALLNSITSGTNRLYKNLDQPQRAPLLEQEIKDGIQLYKVKITIEGVYTNTDYDENGAGYPLREGDENQIYGIHLWYQEQLENGGFDYQPNNSGFTIERDSNGNVIGLSDIQLDEKATSKIYYITFAYLPQLYHQNVYNTYAKKLAEEKLREEEATNKIQEIENKLKILEERYQTLLDEKQELVSDFENMMGPALKEGSWQAENYTDYGLKLSTKVGSSAQGDQYVSFLWDTKAFEEEQLLYYEIGAEQERVYYPCIDISNYLANEDFKNSLNNLSFIYTSGIKEQFEQMGIGSQIQFAFLRIKENEVISYKPVLLLTDKNFSKDQLEEKNYFIGIISSNLNNSGVSVNTKEIIKKENISWVENNDDSIIVYPRIKVNTLLLKTFETVIKYNQEVLENYYDYSILIRDENYYITPKTSIMLKDGNIDKSFDIAYTISNAATSLYLDALEVSKTNAFPQVSYTLEVSAMNKTFIKTAYKNLNRIVSINDTDLKFEDAQGYISELDLNLDNPWEDSITIQNYKTKFEDLFSTIVASSEQMKTNSFAYNNAASAFTSDGLLKPSVIQNTINQTDLTYAFQSGNLTIDEVNGIWAISDSGVVAIRGGGIFCATQTDSNGNWLWNTGIMPSGINASLLTAGQIDTNLIKIFAGDNLRLQLNADGLFAYNKQANGEADLSQYVVHNSDGLFSTIISESGNKINLVEVSWNGFILRNENGNSVFNADRQGNLTIVGTIKAAQGNIGGWLIQNDGLVTTDGKAGIFPKIVLDDEGKPIYGQHSDAMIWVNGIDGNEFRVTKDGTLYCSDAIIKGTVSADSFIGNSQVGEIDEQLRNINISILDGTSYSFENRNYDGNLVITPEVLKFRIYTNALSDAELTLIDGGNKTEGYSFWYGIKEDELRQLSEEELAQVLIWEPNYLTFRLLSDIMYLGLEDSFAPNTILYFKVKKEGRKREVIPETGTISYIGTPEEPYEYSSTIQLTSELFGIGKYITPMTPSAYTFIQDNSPENNIPYEKETSFSVTLTGFTMEEAQNSYWRINDIKQELTPQIKGEGIQEEQSEEINSSRVIAEGEVPFENGDDLIGSFSEDIDHMEIFLEEKEDGSIIATAVIKETMIPEGENVKVEFCLDFAKREAFCFKNRIAADGVTVTISSSSGYTLTSGDTKTELDVKIYYSSQLVNGENSSKQFYYVWKQDEVALSILDIPYLKETENEDLEIIKTEERVSLVAARPETNYANEDFFKAKQIIIDSEDFGLKAKYSCDVFTTLQEAVEEYNKLNQNKDEGLVIEPKE